MGLAVWYPAESGAETVFAENPVFRGGLVRKGAVPRPGKHPVVMLSHGMGGSYLSLNWLASGLAARGAVVVGVNHPNGWFQDRDPVRMFDHWTRAQDVQAALDHVLADPALSTIADPTRIYAAGFSFGGWTVLSLAGSKANLKAASPIVPPRANARTAAPTFRPSGSILQKPTARHGPQATRMPGSARWRRSIPA